MDCKHEHWMRKLINFDEQRADSDPEYPTPVSHQVNLWGRSVYLWYRFGVAPDDSMEDFS